MDSGLYVAIFRLDRTQEISIARLGRFPFERGYYLYVGTAQKRRQMRLARHARRAKPLRWHIDFLSAGAITVGAVLVPGEKLRECKLAERLGE